MAHSFSSLLERLKLQYPCSFSSQTLNRILGDGELLALSKAGVLHQNRLHSEVICQSCEDGHFTEVKYDDENKPFIVCNRESNTRTYLKPNELNTWQFDIPRLLELAAKELKIKGDVKNVVANDLWHIGTLQKDDRHFLIFYSRTNDLNTHKNFFDAFKSPVRAFVIFTNTETPLINLERAEAIVVPIADIVELKKNSLAWDAKSFQEQIIAAFQQVVFYSSNGDFVVLGKTLGNITPSTPEYFFAYTLWENFNQPVSHESIFSYCKEQLGKKNDYTDTAQAFCNKMKSNIKKQLKNGVVDKVIISTKTPNGSNAYKMTNPK